MGRELIRAWLNIGDEVLIGNIGNQLYALKLAQVPVHEAVVEEVARRSPRDTVFAQAARATGPAERRTVTRDDFVRNPYVVAAALLRAEERCEMPGCTRDLFVRDDGSRYLEVHHIVPLGEGGNDSLNNAAALCPACHREMHYGVLRNQHRATVLSHIASLNGTGA
jgi:5-methylcytosine-specific restriction endonuclease McrA